MSGCPICELVERKEGLVYEDDKIAALLAPVPASVGHVWVVPKKHASILEQVPDFVVGEMFAKINKLTIALFESLKPEGTNVIVQSGAAAGQVLPHAIVHVLPRMQGDGLNLQWKPVQVAEDDMGTLELKLKDAASSIGVFETEPQKPVEVETPKEVPVVEDDYQIRQLRRLP